MLTSRTLLAAVLGGAALLVCGYLVIGSWQAARTLEQTLRVGAATAQNSGWPVPERPEDIGYQGDPAAAFDYSFEPVSIDGELGLMPAWLVPPAPGASAKPWAIFVHGIGGRRENGYRFLPTLRDAGLPVLLISYRNDDDAPADPSGLYAFGLTEWRDLEAAVDHAMAAGAPSVVLVAESMGGGIAGQFLQRSDSAGAVSAIVLDAAASDFAGLLRAQMEQMNLPLAPWLAQGALWFSGVTTPIRLAEAETVSTFAAFGGPLFLSHGSGDRVVPVSSSDALVAERQGVTSYLRTGADHIQSWHANPERYEGSLSAFLTTLD
jgi:uncharacterized protein